MSEPILKVKDFSVDFWVDGVWYPAAIKMNFELHPGKVLAMLVSQDRVNLQLPLA